MLSSQATERSFWGLELASHETEVPGAGVGMVRAPLPRMVQEPDSQEVLRQLPCIDPAMEACKLSLDRIFAVAANFRPARSSLSVSIGLKGGVG